jgi:hypothetical protein
MTDAPPHTVNVEWILIGLMVAIVGVILLLDRAGVVRAAGGWNLWPLLLIGLGIRRMIRSRAEGRRGGGVLVFVGCWLLLSSLELTRFRVFWPLALIAVGIGMIWKALLEQRPSAAKTES